jgi:hypothetical protein
MAGERGSNSGVESQPSKLLVAGSNPVSRSKSRAEGFFKPPPSREGQGEPGARVLRRQKQESAADFLRSPSKNAGRAGSIPVSRSSWLVA